jgi:AcrR family transcriptional regulator
MSLLSRPDPQTRSASLTADDWTHAALDVLTDQGIQAVQITALARQLNVTRGSFYWHFDSREALLDALLDQWRARNTGVMVEALGGADTLDDGILALFSVWTDHTRFDSKLDQAIRDWARHSEALLDMLKAEDDARVAAIAEFFRRHGYPKIEAFIRARVIYFTQLSYYALGVSEPMADRISYLSAYFSAFTGREIDPATAAAFRANIDRESGTI